MQSIQNPIRVHLHKVPLLMASERFLSRLLQNKNVNHGLEVKQAILARVVTNSLLIIQLLMEYVFGKRRIFTLERCINISHRRRDLPTECQGVKRMPVEGVGGT